jgi:phage terminase large subunit
VECLKRYCRIIPATTGEPSKPKHDQFSHGADAARYMAQAAPQIQDGMNGLKLPPLSKKPVAYV